MTLTLKDKETDRLAREVAALTGETLTQAVRTSLAERRERLLVEIGQAQPESAPLRLADRLNALGKECAALPDHDTRTPDEIMGYDENGLWH